jgi:hypothetical protein
MSSPSEIGGSDDSSEAGVTSLPDVCAAQGGEASQGGGQGEFPASLTGSL